MAIIIEVEISQVQRVALLGPQAVAEQRQVIAVDTVVAIGVAKEAMQRKGVVLCC